MFRLVIALVWGVVFLGLAEALRRKRPFTRRLVPLLIAGYALYEVGLILVFTATAGQTLILDGLTAVSAVAFTGWALNRTAVTNYFQNDTT